MPLRSLISDLDALLARFGEGGRVSIEQFEVLKDLVARMDDIRHQVAAAEMKLNASLAFAECDMLAQARSVIERRGDRRPRLATRMPTED